MNREALAWLKENNINYIGGSRDKCTNKESRKMVQDLYKKGAYRVDVEIANGTDDYVCELVVIFPRKKSTTRRIEVDLGVCDLYYTLPHSDVQKKTRDIICYLSAEIYNRSLPPRRTIIGDGDIKVIWEESITL